MEAFECNSEHLKVIRSILMKSLTIRSIRMQIPTIRKGFKAFECKFKPFESDSKNYECKFEPFERDSKHSNANLNQSKGIGSIRMQILSIGMQIRTIRKGFESFERDSNHSNASSNHSKGFGSIRMQIQSI